jgi:protein-disulfide isomerase
MSMSKQRRDQGRTDRAAAVRAAQARKERTRRLAVVAGIIVLLGAIVAGGAWYAAGGDDIPATSGDAPPVAAGAASLRMGDADAPVKIVIYEDFLCPFCRELENSTRDFLQENAEAGKVSVEYQPVNLLTSFEYSATAMNAWAAVLKHASPEAALRLHDILFDNQPYEQDSDDHIDDIAGWVDEVVGDDAAVQSAMGSTDTDFFDAAQQAMTAAKITGTPTVVINGQELPATSVVDMVKTIEAAVEQGA